jgi:hypothetical protein
MLFLNWTTTSDPQMPARSEAAGHHWNLWKTRQPPFRELKDGDDVVLVDSWRHGEGRLTWQVSARSVLASQYTSKSDAVRQISRALGLTAAQVRRSEYTARGPDAGYILAWRWEPKHRINLSRPADMAFQRNGWLSLSDPRTLQRWGLQGDAPRRPSNRSPIGQGRLSPAEREVVERYAMDRATEWCRDNGLGVVEDVSKRCSWDLEARRNSMGPRLFVEVKGTTGSQLSVEVTEAEVQHARANPKATALIVVTDIKLKRGSSLRATGGTTRVIEPWSPDDGKLTPTRYRWKPLDK